MFVLLATSVVADSLVADSIKRSVYVGLGNVQGESSYVVSDPTAHLEATLVFPFDITSLAIATDIYRDVDTSLLLRLATSALSRYQEGNDYDRKGETLTVFSSSETHLDSFYQLSLTLGQKLTADNKLNIRLMQQVLDVYWTNTNEQDFVTGSRVSVAGRTLNYKQRTHLLTIGLAHSLFANRFTVEPQILFVNSENIDEHLLRNFSTHQENHAFGYGLTVVWHPIINQHFTQHFSLALAYQTYKDNDSDMRYYYSSGSERKRPASYKHRQLSIELRLQMPVS